MYAIVVIQLLAQLNVFNWLLPIAEFPCSMMDSGYLDFLYDVLVNVIEGKAEAKRLFMTSPLQYHSIIFYCQYILLNII